MIMGHLLLMMSCTDEILQKGDGSENAQNAEVRRSAGDGKLDLLGYGYDATKEFANANSARAKVIDVDRIKREAPGRIEDGIIDIQRTSITSGSNYEEYNKNLSVKVKATAKFLLFSATLKGSFSQEELSSDLYSYASVDLKIQRRRLTIYMDKDELCTKYLTSTFVQDCRKLNAEQLVNRYGTHVLKNIVLGGRLSALYRSKVSSGSKKRVVEAGVSVGVSKIFNIEVDGAQSSSEANKNSEESLRYFTVGGSSSNALVGKIGPKENIVIDIIPWQNSVTLKNAQLIDIDEDGLIPLYELIPDSRKRNEVKNYIFSRIYGLKRYTDYLLNGDIYAIPSFIPSPFLIRKMGAYMQIDDRIVPYMCVALNPAVSTETAIKQALYPIVPYIGSYEGLLRFREYMEVQTLPPPLAYPFYELSAPSLIKDVSGKYYIQLNPNEKKVRPLYSMETIQIYHLDMNKAKVKNIGEYEIGSVLM